MVIPHSNAGTPLQATSPESRLYHSHPRRLNKPVIGHDRAPSPFSRSVSDSSCYGASVRGPRAWCCAEASDIRGPAPAVRESAGMAQPSQVLAIDQGTTSTRAIVFDAHAARRGARPPRAPAALPCRGLGRASPIQRETTVMWERAGGRLHATDVTNASRTLLFDRPAMLGRGAAAPRARAGGAVGTSRAER